MRHLTLPQVVDYVRGVADEVDARAITLHLASGCRACARMVASMRSVETVAAAPYQEVPADVVRRALSVFSAGAGRRVVVRPSMAHAFQLRPFAEVGVRAIAPADAHVVYETNGLVVDVRLDHAPDGQLSVTGQLAFLREQSRGGIPVLAVSHGATLGRAVSSPNGEFQLQFHSADDIHLSVRLAAGNRVDCALNSTTRARVGAPPRMRRCP
jgi:hypothetical protein